MFGRYVTINCLYVKEPIKVWVMCTPDTSMEVLKERARKILIREMEKQLEGESSNE